MEVAVYRDKRSFITSLVKPNDVVLDVGFWGQGVPKNDPDWLHGILLDRVKDVWGLDVQYDESKLPDPHKYRKASAEDFDFERHFDVIVGCDVIEHLFNPGSFLQSCARNIKNGGRLIITTGQCYNLFSMASKLTHTEPIENHDHTCAFSHRLLRQLLQKNGWAIVER
jgi:SAM-dependent methyltransferase